MAHPFELPELGYDHDALEPHIDARTMEIHHGKHHQGYTTKLNGALESHAELQSYTAEQLLMALEALPEDIRAAVRNNGGGYVNHKLFWEVMTPGGSEGPDGELAAAIDGAFGSLDALKSKLTATAGAQFGSGWGWLCLNPFGDLACFSTPNQDSPLSMGHVPILGVDVWEHAYYLNYQNRRPDYLEAWWNLVNWDVVAAKFTKAGGGWVHTYGE